MAARLPTLTGTSFLVALLVALTGSAHAADTCRDLETRSFRSLVDKASTIVLAKATSADAPLFGKNGALTFIFDVEETLKGYQSRPLKIKARLTDDQPDFPRRDLDAHKRMSFWDRIETRLVHVSSCTQDLTFKLGKTYLLIDPGKGIDPMSVRYEMIEDTASDLWLASVRRMIADDNEPAMTMTIDQYIMAQQSVAFAVMSYCNEKLRNGASRIAEISDPLWGTAVKRDGLHPKIFADALAGCNGFTALLGVFYQPDQSRPVDTPLGATIYPGQQYVRLEGDIIHLDRLRTEVTLVGPDTVTLPELITALGTP